VNSNDKSVLLAIALRKLELGIPMLVTPDQDMQSYRNWAKRRGMKIIGEFSTQQQARRRIDAWFHPSSCV
jgi:hypothetical protein